MTGVIHPGGFFLVQAAGGSNGAALPQSDATNTINMGATAGKIALVAGVTGVPAMTCPTDPRIQDFVGFGTANCSETAPASAPSTTTALHRDVAGCFDSNSNAADFVVAPPAPRNSASAPAFCACPTDAYLNESDTPQEADYCILQFPPSLSVPRNQPTDLVYRRLYEDAVTPPAGAPAGVRGQVGYSRPGTDVMTSRWAWFEAQFNEQYGNDDEFQGRILHPGVSTPNPYSYTYRFTFDNGTSWTYCDLNGAGTGGGLTFDDSQLGVMTITP